MLYTIILVVFLVLVFFNFYVERLVLKSLSLSLSIIFFLSLSLIKFFFFSIACKFNIYCTDIYFP